MFNEKNTGIFSVSRNAAGSNDKPDCSAPLQITIDDDFDPQKIIDSGQCFRCSRVGENTFRFITQTSGRLSGDALSGEGQTLKHSLSGAGHASGIAAPDEDHTLRSSFPCMPSERHTATQTHVICMRSLGDNRYEVSCSPDEWNKIWKTYFDLDRSYQNLRGHVQTDSFLSKAMEFGRGIRILRQDPWETLITFIISQRKSIPAIRTCTGLLSARFGAPVSPDLNTMLFCTVNSFPAPADLYRASDSDLASCGLGYRIPYIRDAAERLCREPELINTWRKLDDEALSASLREIKGVGRKIANCVMLFAFGRSACAPIDTWIEKIIKKEYEGINPFPAYGENAGILQQYAFFYAQRHRNEFRS